MDNTGKAIAAGDSVTVRSGSTIWTVLETYADRLGQCLVLATPTQVNRCVELARDCHFVPPGATP